jgi:hypothetical protein
MHRPTIVATALTAIVAILAATAIDSNSLKPATAIPASASIDVMQMMKDAKNLPEEQYDAY